MKPTQKDTGKAPAPQTKPSFEPLPGTHSRDVSLWLDNYDDLFSDFDPRPFSERNISDDFLYEIKRLSRESDFDINEIKLLVPAARRNVADEAIITRRLHSYFRLNNTHFENQMKSERRLSVLITLAGMLMLVSAGYVTFLKAEGFMLRSIVIILEPAGWFLIWTGLDNLINTRKKIRPELVFYRKLVRSKISFISI